MNRDTVAPCDLLEWDTNFFQCRIARVRNDKLDEDLAGRIDAWCGESGVRGLYFLARADDPKTMRTAEKHGFELVDIRVTFERWLLSPGGQKSGPEKPTVPIRSVCSEDLPALQALARTAHNDTRFCSDSHFSRSRADALYSTWIALDCQGRADKVFVATSPVNEPLGYITCNLDTALKKGQIGLVGVSEAARGKGLGRSMVLAAFDWFASQDAQKVTVVTQGRNVAAQRLYQRCGFLTRELQLWYHKWYPAS
jgi:dTDP-4-amino-4,6-dideoxy-D-galactose acyltransferase